MNNKIKITYFCIILQLYLQRGCKDCWNSCALSECASHVTSFVSSWRCRQCSLPPLRLVASKPWLREDVCLVRTATISLSRLRERLLFLFLSLSRLCVRARVFRVVCACLICTRSGSVSGSHVGPGQWGIIRHLQTAE